MNPHQELTRKFLIDYGLADTFSCLQKAVDAQSGIEHKDVDLDEERIQIRTGNFLSGKQHLDFRLSANPAGGTRLEVYTTDTGSTLELLPETDYGRKIIEKMMELLQKNCTPQPPETDKVYSFFCPYCKQRYEGGKEYLNKSIECNCCGRKIILTI